MTTLLTLDPGEMTGWAHWHYDEATPLTHLAHGMIPGGLQGFLAWNTAHHLVIDIDEIVAEDFILDGRTLVPNTTPLEILGALEALRPDLIRQRNVQKAVAPDSLLKTNGLWWPGNGHDRDAARHAIAHMRSIRHMPTLRAFWPRREGSTE